MSLELGRLGDLSPCILTLNKLSYLILSYLILSYLILSYLILSYLILSYLTARNRPLQLVRFVAPFLITWCSLEIYPFVSFKINYLYARKYLRIWKQWFSRVPSRGLKLGNKTYKLKRSIVTERAIFSWVSNAFTLSCNSYNERYRQNDFYDNYCDS